MSDPQRAVEPDEDADDQPLDRTADLLGKLLQVPKEEADEAHRSH